MPLRGLIGSDILANRPDWRVVDNPFADGGDYPTQPADHACRLSPASGR
jgi:hypothetical protein